MKENEEMKQRILDEYPRLGLEDRFSFRCHPKIGCFNSCCADVNIVLTPYDILRLKKRLGITSGEFIERYTVRPFTQDQKLPVVLLRMDDARERKPCQFVTDKGCGVYEDRPWPCRMYPVGQASARTENDPGGPEFFFLMEEDPCDGFGEKNEMTIGQWIEEQKIGPYDEMGQLFKEVTLHPYLLKGGVLKPQQMEMFFTACYDLDRFRSFVFESRFLSLYDVEPERVERLRADDEELLRFAFEWLRTSLFFEKIIKLRDSTVQDYRRRFEEQRLNPKKPG